MRRVGSGHVGLYIIAARVEPGVAHVGVKEESLDHPSYVIITPAHNEEALMEGTIRSVVAQTVTPSQWVIVDDASTDRTAAIVEDCSQQYPWITLVRRIRDDGRDFGKKARAFNEGLHAATWRRADFIGNLDADILLPEDYYEQILTQFQRDQRLGLAGGMVCTRIGSGFRSQKVSLDSVAGAVQLFRQTCMEQMGGYLELPLGGIDAAAEILVRKQGWKVRTFENIEVREQRRTGTATHSAFRARIVEGRRLHALGYSPTFYFARCVRRSVEPPQIIGSVAAMAAYLRAWARNEPLMLPPDVVDFLRSEQKGKLRRLLRGLPPIETELRGDPS